MPTKIKRLSEETINQIAAGEVIENPASVVKELVENSLDAGALGIEVVILSGGQERVRVVDDGCGMPPEEAPLALEPHATSKIGSAVDLEEVMTMGFRGEALASIASISKLTVETSQGGEGVRLTSHGGSLFKTEPIARTRGTTVTVDELFFNTPVRKGFQRSPAADTGQIRKTLTLLALAYPEVSFTLRQGGEVLLEASALPDTPFLEAFQERAREVLGDEFVRGTIPFEHQQGEVRIRGLLGNPSNSRPTRSGQMLLINRRPVVSSLISSTIREAFSTRLATGRHPLLALHIDLPSPLLDVNVHPQKREVRLREESELREGILAAVSKALEVERPAPYPKLSFGSPIVAEEVVPFEPLIPVEEVVELKPPELIEKPLTIYGFLRDYLLLEPTGPFADTDGLLILDTRRAWARIEFERALQALKTGVLASQTLAIPITLELLPDEVEQVIQCKAALHKLGIGVRPFGGNTVLIESLPAFLADGDPRKILEGLLPTLKLEGAWEEAAAKEAIRSAPHCRLTLDQAVPFVREWRKCREPMRCPHGRLTCSVLPLEEIERRLRNAR